MPTPETGTGTSDAVAYMPKEETDSRDLGKTGFGKSRMRKLDRKGPLKGATSAHIPSHTQLKKCASIIGILTVSVCANY